MFSWDYEALVSDSDFWNWLFSPVYCKVTERSPAGFTSTCKPQASWELAETQRQVSSCGCCQLSVAHTCERFCSQESHKNTLQYWTWGTFPSVLICLHHANLQSILGHLIARSAKERVNRKSWVESVEYPHSLCLRLWRSLWHLGCKSAFKSLIFWNEQKCVPLCLLSWIVQVLILHACGANQMQTWTFMPCAPLGLTRGSVATRSGLGAREEPTVTRGALNFLICEQLLACARSERERSKVLPIHPPSAARRNTGCWAMGVALQLLSTVPAGCWIHTVRTAVGDPRRTALE